MGAMSEETCGRLYGNDAACGKSENHKGPHGPKPKKLQTPEQVQTAIYIVDIMYTLIREAKRAKVKQKTIVKLLNDAWEKAL
jgi:hypothetical protein